ncbi:MAG: hypothetical protein ACXWV8_14500 [Chitinophagaceae bacterium]
MRLFIIWSAIFFSLISIALPVSSATSFSPSSSVIKIVPEWNKYKNIANLKIKDLQKIIGRKLTVKEKIGFIILKHKIKRQLKNSEKQGQTAFIMGIAGLALFAIGLFVPVLLVGSLIAAIVAVVSGSVAQKQDPSNRKAHAGKLLGWITLGLLALLLILAAIVLSAWTGWL